MSWTKTRIKAFQAAHGVCFVVPAGWGNEDGPPRSIEPGARALPLEGARVLAVKGAPRRVEAAARVAAFLRAEQAGDLAALFADPARIDEAAELAKARNLVTVVATWGDA